MKPSRIEQAMVTYLSTTGIHVSTRVPKPRPARFVRVTRTGGAAPRMVVSEPTLLVECWGATDGDAWTVVEAVWPLCSVPHSVQISADVWASRMWAQEPVNFPDGASGSPRYQFIVTARVALTGGTP